MIQLVLVYCLADAPKSCVEKRPLLPDGMQSALSCMVAAQPMAADWLRAHPAYVLKNFRCEIDKPDERKT